MSLTTEIESTDPAVTASAPDRNCVVSQHPSCSSVEMFIESREQITIPILAVTSKRSLAIGNGFEKREHRIRIVE